MVGCGMSFAFNEKPYTYTFQIYAFVQSAVARRNVAGVMVDLTHIPKGWYLCRKSPLNTITPNLTVDLATGCGMCFIMYDNKTFANPANWCFI